MARNRMLSELAVGTKVTAEVNSIKRNFIVVHQGRPSSIYSSTFDNSTILMLEDIHENRQWHSSNINSYSASTIHSYLNSTFLNLCAPVIKNNVKQVKIPYRAGEGYGTSIMSGESGLAAKIWLPSGYEVGFTTSDSRYFPADGAKFSFFLSGNASDAQNKRLAYLNGSAVDWWLRSPWCNSSSGSTIAWVVSFGGSYNEINCSNTYGIRPALALPSTLFVSENGDLTEDNGLSGIYVKKAGIWVPVF